MPDTETVSIPARFEQLVECFPDKAAIRGAAEALTYAEVNRLANRLAHAILALRGPFCGPGP
jgi:non-ribosomal peptide synthetase component F